MAHKLNTGFLSPPQAAKVYGIPERTIRDWCKDGKLPALIKKYGTKCTYLITPEAFEAVVYGEVTPCKEKELQKTRASLKSTFDYDKFQFLKYNREINQLHLQKLTMSFQKDSNLLKYNPVLVDKAFNVYDGQHRVLAAKLTNSPVYYMIIQSDVSPETLVVLNANQKPWALNDYMQFFALQGNENYIRLSRITDKYKFNPRVIVMVLDQDKQPDPVRKIKEGVFVFTLTDAAKVEKFFSEFIDIFGNNKKLLSYRNIRAFLKFKKLERLDKIHLKKAFKGLGNKLDSVPSARYAFEKMVSIYNNRLSQEKKLIYTNQDILTLEKS